MSTEVAPVRVEGAGNRVDDVLIIGGGTSGWMTALALARAHPRLGITLVEASDVPTVGVGEATLNTLDGFLQPAGIDEDTFIARTNATAKLGIRYPGWSERSYWHPFGEVLTDGAFLQRWAIDRARRGALAPDLDDHAGLGTWELAAAGLAPKYVDDPGYDTRTVRYGYHLDAGAFATLLRERSVAAGVVHVVDHVVDVRPGPDGVGSVQLRERGEMRADLYIDCSGFRSLLLGQALGEPFESYAQWLPNDAAVAAHRARPGDGPIDPYVTATALGHGWAWTIPLWDRDGVGYVYSTSHLDPADAERDLLAHVGGNGVDGGDVTNISHLRMRIGRSRRCWVGNCVGIGLAGGFIEPLESTGLFMVDLAQEQLCERLTPDGFTDADRDGFNRVFAEVYEGIRDFIVIHFATADRSDTEYWRECTTDPDRLPDRVAGILERWRSGLAPRDAPGPFHPASWMYVLDGNRYWPERAAELVNRVDPAVDIGAVIRASERKVLVGKLPGHREWIAAVRARAGR